MNKEVNFSRFVGVAVIIIGIIIVLLALMSAIVKNENANNIIYMEDTGDTLLGVPKSNIITKYTINEKKIQIGEYYINTKGKLPKVNLKTDSVNNLNDEIYSNYQQLYSYSNDIVNNQDIEFDYTYNYIDNDKFLQIIIKKKTVINETNDIIIIKYIYDIENDCYEVIR